MNQEMNFSTEKELPSDESQPTSRKPSPILRWAVNIGLGLLALLVILIGVSLVAQTISGSGIKAGEVAPAIVGRDLNGNAVDSRTMTGQPIMLVFWSPDCYACADVYPTLQAISEDPHPPVQLITVSGDATVEETVAKMQNLNLTFSTIVDVNEELLDLFNVPGYPHTLLINPNGTVDHVIAGISVPDELEVAVDHWAATCDRGTSCSAEIVEQ